MVHRHLATSQEKKRYYEDLWLKTLKENKKLFNMKQNEYITKCNTRKIEYYFNKIHECGKQCLIVIDDFDAG